MTMMTMESSVVLDFVLNIMGISMIDTRRRRHRSS
jgi:hypothetical protein